MLIVPLRAVPSQTVRVTLNNQPCRLRVYQRKVGLFADVYVNDALIIGGVIAYSHNKIVRSVYLGFVGDLAFINLVDRDNGIISFDKIGSECLLLYYFPAEL